MKLGITYTTLADGVSHTAEQGENEHFSLNIVEERERIRVELLPKEAVSFDRFQIILDYAYQPDSRIFVNGYQSWTDSKEYFVTDRMSRLHPLSRNQIMHKTMRFAGDYTFKEYPRGKGFFFGYSYSYVRNGETVDLFASLSERSGYTIFNFDCGNNRVVVEKDLEGIAIEQPYLVFDLIRYQGGYEEVFDRYFMEMAVPKPRVKHQCGYTTWYNYYPNINEKIVANDLEALDKLEKRVDIFQIDDGFQTAVGDWLSIDSAKFPRGLKPIVEEIHSKNMLAGLWLAPLGCEYKAKVVEEHPDWLFKNPDGSFVECGGNWGGFYALDFTLPPVQEHIRRFFDVVLREWNFDLVKLDFLYAACIIPNHNKTRGQLMCEAMDFIRECVGDKLILGCGVPLAPAFGKVDFCRIGADMGLHWHPTPYDLYTHREDVSTNHAVNNSIFRRSLDGRAWCNDPDVFLLRDYNIQLTFAQRKLLSKINKIFGNLLFISDNVDRYNEEQMAVFLDTIQESEISVRQAEYIGKNIISVRFTEDGEEKTLVFHVGNGKLIEGAL